TVPECEVGLQTQDTRSIGTPARRVLLANILKATAHPAHGDSPEGDGSSGARGFSFPGAASLMPFGSRLPVSEPSAGCLGIVPRKAYFAYSFSRSCERRRPRHIDIMSSIRAG